MTTDNRHYLMSRRGVKSLTAAFSKTMDALEKEANGLGLLSLLRKEAQEREHWNDGFNAFHARWSEAFDDAHAGDDSKSCAMRDSGLQCLGAIQGDLRNDLWTDKTIKNHPELTVFQTSFWKLVHQKMKYAPIIIACGVSRETAIRMTKFATARIQILSDMLLPPTTERALFEMIAERIGATWATVEKIEEDLPRFLESKGSSRGRLLSLDEFDFHEALPTNEESKSTHIVLFDALPVGSVSALEAVIPDVVAVLAEHCLPELKKGDRALYDAFVSWQKEMESNAPMGAPEDQVSIEIALQLLRDCIEGIFRSRLK